MELWANILISTSVSGVVGFLFWAYLNNRFDALVEKEKENRARIRELEEEIREYVLKEDHHQIRLEDKQGLERRLQSIEEDLKEMPQQIVNLIKPFLKP